MSTTEILKAIDTTPTRSKPALMRKLAQRLEDFYDVQSVKAAHRRDDWVPFDQVEKEIEAKRARAKAGRN
jgi:hypothetical protein